MTFEYPAPRGLKKAPPPADEAKGGFNRRGTKMAKSKKPPMPMPMPGRGKKKPC